MERKIPSENELTAFALMMIFLTLALFSSPAFAAQCLTDVSTTTSASRATTGTSVTITVTTTGTSCTVSTLSFVSSPALTINDPASGQYSGFTAGTAKSFTITAGTSGTYTYYAQGTTSDGSVQSTQAILEFISPSDMTVTSTPSSASVTDGSTFTWTVNIQNSQSSDISTSYALNLPSGLTRQSGDPASSSGITVSASSTKSLSFTIKHSTCFTGSKTINFDIGDSSSAASVSVSGNSSCATGTSNASTTTGGGGGGGGEIKSTKTYATGKATISVPVIYAGSTEAFELTPTETNVRKIEVTVVGIARSIEIVIEKSSLTPGTPAAPGNIFHYISVSKKNLSDENVKSAKIEFRVEKSWISGKKIDESTIALHRYTAQWDKMSTTKLSDDESYVYYSASLPGLSLFAISGEKTPEGAAEEKAAEEAAKNVTGNVTGGPGQPFDAGIFVWIIGIVVVLAGVYFVYTKFFAKKEYAFRTRK